MKYFIIIGFLILSLFASGQGISKGENDIFKAYKDSLLNMDYPYNLPILGKQVYKKGYDIPHAYGISLVYFSQSQEININKTLIGFSGGEKVDLTDVIQFGPTKATTHALTVRPDIWVLPFFNLYGIIGGGTTNTDVSLLEPVGFETSQYFEASSFGVGATLTGKVGPMWVAWDNNYNFVDVDVIVEPIPAFNSSFRLGTTMFSQKNPERSLAVWVGAFYQALQSDTKGSIGVQEIFPSLGTGQNIERLRDWSQTLPPAKRVVVNQIINKLEEAGSGVDVSNSTIDYELQKEVAYPVNVLLGAQYQFNKRWILRSETGVYGGRSQFMLNLNYRIPGFKKTN